MGDTTDPSANGQRGCGRRITKVMVVVCIVLVVIVLVPRLLRTSEIIRDRSLQLGEEQAHVVVVASHDRSFFQTPHFTMFGGGNWRYDTAVEYASGRRITFTTEVQPRALWQHGDRLFAACCNGGHWLIGEVSDGQVFPFSRAARQETPPLWNLESPEYHAEWDEDFNMWAK